MTVYHAAATLALAYGAGASLFWTAVATPALFRRLPREAVGAAVAAVFPRYFESQTLAAAAALVALALANAVGGGASTLAGPLVVVAGAAAAVNRFVLLARTRAAERGTDAFRRAHGLSALANLATTLAFVAALAALAL
ncbi:MAG TPA: DUF4149 domain-containing protein [Candidatus Thermoplasmatota archaeon]|nr:DUF4149 domain-containing protein [Candidatus Thermoplasmatota archaeon]